jgi:two-component system OmpR family response regulator
VDIRVLLIESAAEAGAGSLAGYLRRAGIDVQALPQAAPWSDTLAASDFDLLLLECALSDAGSAIDACRSVRRRSEIPIILLFDREDWLARVACLDSGADDCLCRPFEPRELVARIAALARRSGGRRWSQAADDAQATIRFDGWLLESAQRRLVSPRGQTVPLSALEFRLLWALVSHPRQVLSRRHVAIAMDPAATLTASAVDSSVARLRRKLGRDATLIRTVRSEGYVFGGEVADSDD